MPLLQTDQIIENRDGLTVRHAQAEDLPALIRLGHQAHFETHYSFVPFDEAKLMTVAARYFSQTGRHCIFVAERGRILVGFLAGLLDEYFFSRAHYARDVIFFVDPNSRGGPAARRLIDAFAAWAEAHGALEVQVGISSGRKIELAGLFLERHGFASVGGLYKKRLKS